MLLPSRSTIPVLPPATYEISLRRVSRVLVTTGFGDSVCVCVCVSSQEMFMIDGSLCIYTVLTAQ